MTERVLAKKYLPLYLSMVTGGLVFPLIGTLVAHLKASTSLSDNVLAFIPIVFESGFLFTMLCLPVVARLLPPNPSLGIIVSSVLIVITNAFVGFNPSASVSWFIGVFIFGGAVSLLIGFAESTAVSLSRAANNPKLIGYSHALMFVGNLFYLGLAYLIFANSGKQTWLFVIPTVASILTLGITLTVVLPKTASVAANVKSKSLGSARIIFILGGFSLTIEVVLLNLAGLIFRDADPKMITIAIALFSGGGIIGRTALPYLLQKMQVKMKSILLLSNSMCLFTCIALYFKPHLILFFLAGLSSSVLVPTLISALTSINDLDPGKAVSNFWSLATAMLILYLVANFFIVSSETLQNPVITVIGVCILGLLCLVSRKSEPSLNRSFQAKI